MLRFILNRITTVTMFTQTRLNKRQTSAFSLFLALFAFNVFLQFDIAEDLFDSLFSGTEITAFSSPVCGTHHQIADASSSDKSFTNSSSFVGFSSHSGKSKQYARWVTPFWLANSESQLALDTVTDSLQSISSFGNSGLSPPIA
jgi:hypothetical protein